MQRKCIMIFLFALWLKVDAQQRWTLRECIEYGLKNNRNKTIFVNGRLAADALAREAIADFLPRVSLTAALDNNLRLQQSIIPAGVLGPTEMRVSFTQKYSSDAMGQIDQVIFDESMIKGLQASKYVRDQADLKIVQSEETIIYNISTAYFQILVFREELNLLEYNKSTYERQRDILRLQLSKGTILQKDLDKVSVEYNNTLSNIRVAESNLQLVQNQLKYEMGYPISGSLSVPFSTSIALPLRRESCSGLFSVAARTDYQLSGLNIKVLAVEQARIRAEGLPKLSAYFRYGAVGFGDNFGGAYNELFPYSTLGLKLNIPILDFYKRSARYRQATINRLNAEETLKLSEAKYSIEYENARTKLLQAEANVENDRRNVALAESVLKVTDLQFQKGTTDLTDWLNTQHALKEAQNGYLNALYSYYQVRVDLEKAAGSLKLFYHSL